MTKQDMEVQDLRMQLDVKKAEIDRLQSELQTCRNELCLRCGDYKRRHLGACDGCRWKEAG